MLLPSPHRYHIRPCLIRSFPSSLSPQAATRNIQQSTLSSGSSWRAFALSMEPSSCETGHDEARRIIMEALKETQLYCPFAYIDGSWVAADSGEQIEVLNPATGEVFGTVPRLGRSETERAIAAADAALVGWRDHTAQERADILMKWHDLMLEHQDDLAMIMTHEQGKPLKEAAGEIVYAASFIRWFAEEARRIYGETIPAAKPNQRIVITKQPVGVVAAITPWNFPNAMITRKAGAALAAGCTIVIKPATATPYSALALAELAQEAGIPPGVLNVVTGNSGTVGEELTGNPIVRKLSFTGSTSVGKHLMRQCAGTM